MSQLGALACQLGSKRVMVISDPGVVATGHAARGIDCLSKSGLVSCLFDAVRENPTTDHINAGTDVARDFRPDLLVAIGGGSSMDCAKGINFLFSCGGRMQDYWGRGKAGKPMLASIAVPTTAGTGSETQSFALVSDAHSGVKMACGDPAAAFRIAILDVGLTLTQPPRVTALTGIDAVSHALESYVTKARTPVSMIFSRESWRLLSHALPRVLANPTDEKARADVQLGASLAGIAIEHSMLGVAHALANPLTADHGVPHGQAVSLMLPHVIRFNASICGPDYADLWNDLIDESSEGRRIDRNDPEGAFRLSQWIENLVRQAGLATSLAEAGVESPQFDRLSVASHEQWTAGFNPRSVTIDDLFTLYILADQRHH